MINGGSNGGLTNHLPWYHGDKTVEIYRYFATLHSELVPYIFSYNVEANKTGEPLIRSSDINRAQYKLGEFIFVSAITDDVLFKKVLFPKDGYWIDYWNENNVFKGNTELTASVPLNQYPLYLKAGAIIPMNVTNDLTWHGDNTSIGKQTVFVYPYMESSMKFYKPKGTGQIYSEVEIKVNEKEGNISIKDNEKTHYRLYIKSFDIPEDVSGADYWAYDSVNHRLVIDVIGQSINIKIKGLKGYSYVIKK